MTAVLVLAGWFLALTVYFAWCLTRAEELAPDDPRGYSDRELARRDVRCRAERDELAARRATRPHGNVGVRVPRDPGERA